MVWQAVDRVSGQPWWVAHHLDAAATEDIVIPEPIDVVPVAGGDANAVHATRHAIVLTGIYYQFEGDADGEGFSLSVVDDSFNPGTTTTRIIWRDFVTAAGRVHASLPDLWIPLSRGQTLTTPSSGAKVSVTVVGPAINGILLLQGLHTNDAYHKPWVGSPIAF